MIGSASSESTSAGSGSGSGSDSSSDSNGRSVNLHPVVVVCSALSQPAWPADDFLQIDFSRPGSPRPLRLPPLRLPPLRLQRPLPPRRPRLRLLQDCVLSAFSFFLALSRRAVLAPVRF